MNNPMPSVPNVYVIGDTMFSVTPDGGGAQLIKATVPLGDHDETGTLHLGSGSVTHRAGVELLKRIVEKAFSCELLESDSNTAGEYSFRLQPPTGHAMKIKPKPAILQEGEHIVELKPLPEKLKKTLSDETFDEFMLAVSKHFPTEAMARATLDKMLAFEERRKKALATAAGDIKEAHIEQERLARATKQVGHLLRPIVYTLAEHGVFIDKDLSDALVFALLEGFSKTDDKERMSKEDAAIGKTTENYFTALERRMSELGVEVDNPKKLKSDLLINMGKAEKEERGRRAA